MKIQCSCGVKYAFDVTPDMALAPVRFVCQSCGRDSSELVNQLIRQQLAAEPAPPPPAATAPASAPPSPPPAPAAPSAAPVGPKPIAIRIPTAATAPSPAPAPPVAVAAPPPAPSAPVPVTVTALPLPPTPSPPPSASVPPPPPPAPPPPAPAPALQVQAHAAPTPPATEAASDAAMRCAKHPEHEATHRCLVCSKPMCPDCMTTFGFVCSAYCKGKAESQRMVLPEYEGQRDVAERRAWGKIGRIGFAAAALVALLVGAWAWYAFYASKPKVVFSAKLPEAAYAGQSRFAAQDQLVFLAGGRLARYDLKTGKEAWSALLIDKAKIKQQAAQARERMKEGRERAIAEGADPDFLKVPPLDELETTMLRGAAASFQLHVQGENIWVQAPDKLIHCDWQTGKSTKDVPLREYSSRVSRKGDELQLQEIARNGAQVLTRINLATGESQRDQILPPSPALAALVVEAGDTESPTEAPAVKGQSAKAAPRGTNTTVAAGRAPRRPAMAANPQPGEKPLDPQALASKVQNMSYAGRIALPAVLAANLNQQRALAAMREDQPGAGAGAGGAKPQREAEPQFQLIPAGDGFVQFGVKLLESRIVTRQAMKAPPKKSALDGDVNMAATTDIANEILNEIQRERTGGVEEEDESRYQVIVRRPGAKGAPDFSAEVVGPPSFIPVKTVDVVTAGKTMIVLDKNNKRLWESKLNFPLRGGWGGEDEVADGHSFGQGPCVERGDLFYVFDQGVLTAFELASGNARWRLPTVGVVGLFFDDKGMIYVNTTTGSPESIRYSRQIDISQKTKPAILKVDPQTGKMLWRLEDEGMLTYVSGKFLYTTETYIGDDDEDGGPLGMKIGLEIPPHIRIQRIHPGSGKILWKHYQKRAPLDYQFNQNTIQVLFKKEVQVLRFLSL